LSLKAENLDALRASIEAAAMALLQGGDVPTVSLLVDSEVRVSDLSARRMRRLESLAPFGAANREPTFMLRRVRVMRSRMVGRNNVRLRLRGDRAILEVLGFSVGEASFEVGEVLDVVVTPRVGARGMGGGEFQLLAYEKSR